MNPPLSSIIKFYEKLVSHENDRFRSFEHCYQFFKKYKNNNHDIELAMLHLGFYLASWGMYRGSSFLLQKDYRIYYEIIQILFKKEFDELWCIEKNLNSENKEKYGKLTLNLHELLQDYLEKERNKYLKYMGKNKTTQEISSVLTTKIMMGTLGCIPAYDRYFRDGIKIYNENNKSDLIQLFSINSIMKIYDFLINNKIELIKLQDKIHLKTKMEYPLMKLIDSYFWLIGFEVENTVVKK